MSCGVRIPSMLFSLIAQNVTFLDLVIFYINFLNDSTDIFISCAGVTISPISMLGSFVATLLVPEAWGSVWDVLLASEVLLVTWSSLFPPVAHLCASAALVETVSE